VEDKIFEFTEKMYSDLKKEIQNVGNQVTNFETNTKYSALFDGCKQTYETLQEHDRRFDSIENKLNAISTKVSSHDSKLEVLEKRQKEIKL
jgi:archaellum component FlaC